LKPALLGCVAAAIISATAAQSQQPVKIRASWVAPVANWASILAEKPDLARHAGKSYVFESVRFAGTPPMITALAITPANLRQFVRYRVTLPIPRSMRRILNGHLVLCWIPSPRWRMALIDLCQAVHLRHCARLSLRQFAPAKTRKG
jgi:hypothetical protein